MSHHPQTTDPQAFDPQVYQQKYEQWHALIQQQRHAQAQFAAAQALMDEVLAYYQSPQWHTDRQQEVCLEYSGSVHSILSEDGVWNSLSDHRELAQRWVALGQAALAADEDRD